MYVFCAKRISHMKYVSRGFRANYAPVFAESFQNGELYHVWVLRVACEQRAKSSGEYLEFSDDCI